MKIIVAPQSYKGTLSADSVSRAIQDGIQKVLPNAEVILCPVADGGEGTLEVIAKATQGEIVFFNIKRALGEKTQVPIGIIKNEAGQTALIELATICGLNLVKTHERNPMTATTFGVGEAIKEGLERGIRNFIIALGGSATNDGGAGMAQALGARLLDIQGKDLPPGGSVLKNLHRIDLTGIDKRIAISKFVIACDVLNPLLGPEGATQVYSAQKGATPEQTQHLESALKHYSDVIKRDLGIDVSCIPGGGSAGGCGAGCAAFLKGELRSGIDFVLEQIQFENLLQKANLVITGEGRMDRQTQFNKAPFGVAMKAKMKNIPVIAIVGTVGEGYENMHQYGIDAIIPTSFNSEVSFPQNPGRLIAQASEEALRCFLLFRKNRG